MKPVLERGVYRVGCTYNNKRMRRSAYTSNETAANRLQNQIDCRLEQLMNGVVMLPPGMSVRRFLLYGQGGPDKESAGGTMTMHGLRAAFMASLGPPRISAAYLETLSYYDAHFGRFLDVHPELPENPAEWCYLEVEQYRAWRLKEDKKKKGGRKGARRPRPYTVAKELAFLGRMFRFGIRRDWLKENPLDKVESLPDTKPEVPYRTVSEAHRLLETTKVSAAERRIILSHRYFLVEEIDEFLLLLWERSPTAQVERPDDIAMITTLAAWTGMRFGEITRLDRIDIDLELGVITTRSRKQSRSRGEVQRHVPIVDELMPRLRTWLQLHPGRLLFGPRAESDNFRDAFYRGLDRMTRGTKFQRVRPHMLRHSMRSNLTMAGQDERRIDEILGHTTEETRQRYRHIQIARLKSSMEALKRRSGKPREDVQTSEPDEPEDNPTPRKNQQASS